jgi:hypothetical protein
VNFSERHTLVVPRALVEQWIADLAFDPAHVLRTKLVRTRTVQGSYWHVWHDLPSPYYEGLWIGEMKVLFSGDINVQPVHDSDCALIFGAGLWEGALQALRSTPSGWLPFDIVKFPGWGMEQLLLKESRQGESQDRRRWQRTSVALGSDVLARLRRLRVVVVGVGRAGSVLASRLVTLGVNEVCLIDQDLVTVQDLGQLEFLTSASLGSPRADMLATAVAPLARETGTRISTLSTKPHTPDLESAFSTADILAYCGPSETDRSICGLHALAWNLVLLDTRTQAQRLQPVKENKIKGDPAKKNVNILAEIRLIVPGRGCAFCKGRLSGSSFLKGGFAPLFPDNSEEIAQVLGSLGSLDCVAGGLALRTLEELVSGRVKDSSWVRIAWSADGQPELDSISTSPSRKCLFCGALNESIERQSGLAGVEDAGIQPL